MLDNIQNSFEEFTSIKDYSEMLNNIIQIKKEKLIPSLLKNQRRLLVRKKIFAKLLGDNVVEKNKTTKLFVTEEMNDVVNNTRFPLFEFENVNYVYIKNNPNQLTKEEVHKVFEITKPQNVINKYHILNIKDLENLYDQYLEFIDMLSDEFIDIQEDSLKKEFKKYDETIINHFLQSNLNLKNINYKKLKDYKNIIWNKKINSQFEQNKSEWIKNILKEIKQQSDKIKKHVHELNEESLKTLKNNLQDLISYSESFSKNEIEMQQQIITNYFNGSLQQKGLLEKIDDLQKLSTNENIDKILEEIKLTLPVILKEKGLINLYSIVTEVLSNNAFEHTPYLDEVIKNTKHKLEQKNYKLEKQKYKYRLYEFANNLNFENLPNKEELIFKYKDKINLLLEDENILMFSEVIETISNKIKILLE